MYRDKQSFYKSSEWEKLRQIVIDERTNDDGYVICDICGKPILKKYDLILHHKTELDDLNVMDANIALNPDNLQCVHFACHNKLHVRHSEGTQRTKHVYIVYGSPCSGKTHWVQMNASEDDLIVDLDSVWESVSTAPRYVKPSALKSVVYELRDKLYDIVKYRSGKWTNAFVITTAPLVGDRQRLQQRLQADELIFIDATREECLDNLTHRDMPEEEAMQWIQYIDEWFDRYQCD